MLYFASFGFHNSSYDSRLKGSCCESSQFVCLHKRRLLGYGRRFTIEARIHFVSPVYLRWEIKRWQICSTVVVSQVCSVSSFDATASQPADVSSLALDSQIGYNLLPSNFVFRALRCFP